MTMAGTEAIESTRRRLAEIQSGASGRFILFSHDPTGLGGQIDRRVMALRIALITGRTALFLNESLYPYENPFAPLSQARCDPAEAVDVPIERLLNAPEHVCRFDFWAFWANEALRRRVYAYVPPAFAQFADPGFVLDGLIFSTFGISPHFQAEHAEWETFRAQAQDCVGVHYRRGDKYVETPYVPASVYRAEIMRVARGAGIRKIFIASDSARAQDELALDGEFEVIFDCKEKRYNNANHKFLMRNQHLARQETLTAMKNIHKLSLCTKVVGQTNAHFARIAAGQISVRRPFDSFGGLLDPQMVKLSAPARARRSAYILVRSAAKRLLPSLTLRKRPLNGSE